MQGLLSFWLFFYNLAMISHNFYVTLRPNILITIMKPSDFIHPENAAALRQMEEIPDFAVLDKKILAIGIENLQYGVNMVSSMWLSEKQMPKIYRHLPPICKCMGIPEPEFYLQMNPIPNAWTSGDTRINIIVTSSLVEMMSDEELDARYVFGYVIKMSLFHYKKGD